LKIGIVSPQFGQSATKENIVQTAKTVEQEEDIDSLWVIERLLWPLKPQTPNVASPDGSLPTEYQNVLDPLETLTYVAANTNNIALGTSVIDMLFHNPVMLARRFATLDVLSEERAIAGLGIGWSKDEYQVSNIPFSNKGKRADEFIQALKKIWTDDVVEFKGEYYNIPASKIDTHVCEECVKDNIQWISLRLCVTCGHVGCDDSSAGMHATKHFVNTGHPVIVALPDKPWKWCYIHKIYG
jgi:alkanesulfonate monooxygenase SsuD/methylene tetrahydromethanopterin reductase-like flavin-dependent oxidoreductase (luciferase family)